MRKRCKSLRHFVSLRITESFVLFAGPIFSREALTQPRQLRHYLVRSGYIGLLFILIWTAGQTTFGYQDVRGNGAMASFGTLLMVGVAACLLTAVCFLPAVLRLVGGGGDGEP